MWTYVPHGASLSVKGHRATFSNALATNHSIPVVALIRTAITRRQAASVSHVGYMFLALAVRTRKSQRHGILSITLLGSHFDGFRPRPASWVLDNIELSQVANWEQYRVVPGLIHRPVPTMNSEPQVAQAFALFLELQTRARFGH